MSEETVAFRMSVRSFCEHEIDRDLVRRMDAEDRTPPEVVDRLAELGYVGLAFPEQYGGGGGGLLELLVLAEELTRVSSALCGAVITTALFGGMNLLHLGTEEQRADLLPRICSGRLRTALAVTEPDAGSDVASLSTKAVLDEDGWRISGTKMFTSGALEAGLIMVLARTGEGPRPHDGLSMILVPNPSAGLTVRKLTKLGTRGTSACEVVLVDVRVPADAVLGGPDAAGTGWRQVMTTFDLERAVLAATSVGIAQSALDDAVRYARERHQFGRAIGDFQAVGHLLADMATRVEACRAFLAVVAERMAAGVPSSTEAAMVKLFATETAKQVCLDGMQVLGGYGYLPEFDMERHLRDSLLGPVGGGTSQIQRTIIARSLGFAG